MAKAIEQTPILEGKDAERFIDSLTNSHKRPLTEHEKKVKELIKKIPPDLKLN